MKIERYELKLSDFLAKNGVIIKELTENQILCSVCDGLGMKVQTNEYRVKVDVANAKSYVCQSLVPCTQCEKGVVSLCKYCKTPLKPHHTRCTCKDSMLEERKEELNKIEELYKKAQKVTYVEYIEKYPDYMLYDAQNYTYYQDAEQLMESKEDGREVSKYVFATHQTQINLCVDDIVEQGCEELYEDVLESLQGVDELTHAVEIFNMVNEGTTATFYPNYAIAVTF